MKWTVTPKELDHLEIDIGRTSRESWIVGSVNDWTVDDLRDPDCTARQLFIS
jgi:hypothetical protein